MHAEKEVSDYSLSMIEECHVKIEWGGLQLKEK